MCQHLLISIQSKTTMRIKIDEKNWTNVRLAHLRDSLLVSFFDSSHRFSNRLKIFQFATDIENTRSHTKFETRSTLILDTDFIPL